MKSIKAIKRIANRSYAPIKERLKLYYRPKQYVKKWGKETGLALYKDFFNFSAKGELTQFHLPGYPHLLYLRKDTSDEPTLRQVFMNIRYDMDLPFRPKTILDGGANVGYASVFFAQKYPEAEILSVEPDSSNFKMIQRNIKSYQNIKALQSAIWGSSTHLKIKNPEMESWAFEVVEADAKEAGAFQAFSVGALIERMHWKTIDILKLDIEGAEMSVFQQNYEAWLPKVKLLIIELHEKMRPGCTAVFEGAINQYNFESSVSGENLVYLNKDLT